MYKLFFARRGVETQFCGRTDSVKYTHVKHNDFSELNLPVFYADLSSDRGESFMVESLFWFFSLFQLYMELSKKTFTWLQYTHLPWKRKNRSLVWDALDGHSSIFGTVVIHSCPATSLATENCSKLPISVFSIYFTATSSSWDMEFVEISLRAISVTFNEEKEDMFKSISFLKQQAWVPSFPRCWREEEWHSGRSLLKFVQLEVLPVIHFSDHILF